MGKTKAALRLTCAVGGMALLTAGSALAATTGPEVQKVEPPSWWPGHSVNPVRLMIRGRNLSGATVAASAQSGLTVGLTRVNA
ncbi:MAG TPA: cyclomaltodextrinase N-terminal domain-containing protein, partial [Vicinamibacteria bacterium]